VDVTATSLMTRSFIGDRPIPHVTEFLHTVVMRCHDRRDGGLNILWAGPNLKAEFRENPLYARFPTRVKNKDAAPGIYYPPSAIFCFVRTRRTLPARAGYARPHLRSGGGPSKKGS